MSRLHEYDQHFLRSPRLVAELIGHSNLKKRDLVYDFGAGSGVISSVLAGRCRHVVAVENEPSALETLRTNLGHVDNVTIVAADMLEVELPGEPYNVFCNPPFSIISDLIRRLTESPNPPQKVYCIVQKQFARKVVPSDQHFTSALGIQLSPIYAARIRRPLRKTDFTPPPAVDTVLLELKLLEKPLLATEELAGYRNFVSVVFENPTRLSAHTRTAAGVSPEKKPSEISPQLWIELFRRRTKR